MDRDNGVHVHSGIFLNHKEVGNNAKSSLRKESRDDHSKRSEGDKERQVSYDIISRYKLTRDTNEPISWRHSLPDLENKLLVTRYKDVGQLMRSELLQTNICTLLLIK